MKKIIAIIVCGLVALTSAIGFGTAFASEENKVMAEKDKLIQWADYTEWTDEGLAVYAGQWEGAGLTMFFDVSNGKEFNIKFKVPVYENESENNVSSNGVIYTKYIVDMIVESFDNSGLAVLRLWGDSGKNVGSSNVAAKITCGDLHDKSSSTNPNEVAEDVWVKGVMRENSEFDISFNTTDFFKAVWGDWLGNEKGSLLTVSNTIANGQAVKDSLNAIFNPENNPCNTVQVYFRLSAQCPHGEDNCPITGCPELDPNSMSKMIITEINGQSLANENGELVDNVAPFVAPLKIKGNKEININKQYSLQVKMSPRDNTEGDFYSDYSSDVASYEQLSFSAKVVAPSNKETVYDGYDSFSNISFTEVGTHKMTITVVDMGGNSYTTEELIFEAVRGFELKIEGVPEQVTVGETVTLPSGVATDKYGQSCEVKIVVTDAFGKQVALGENNTFTPEKQSVYKVLYTAESEDGTGYAEQEFKIRAVEKEKGCGSSIEDGSFVALSLSALMISTIILKKKRG